MSKEGPIICWDLSGTVANYYNNQLRPDQAEVIDALKKDLGTDNYITTGMGSQDILVLVRELGLGRLFDQFYTRDSLGSDGKNYQFVATQAGLTNPEQIQRQLLIIGDRESDRPFRNLAGTVFVHHTNCHLTSAWSTYDLVRELWEKGNNSFAAGYDTLSTQLEPVQSSRHQLSLPNGLSFSIRANSGWNPSREISDLKVPTPYQRILRQESE